MSHRLAFRELGMAIGLKALPMIIDAINGVRSEVRWHCERQFKLFCHTKGLAETSSMYGSRMLHSLRIKSGKPTKTSMM
jgi:hypothetical protein